MINNPINYMLFKYGYTGKENIYEFWMENKDDFIFYLQKSAPRIAKNQLLFLSFEAKVRWCSPYGIQFTNEIREIIQNHTIDKPINFNSLSIKCGNINMTLKSFLEDHPVGNSYKGLFDLRGIKILRVALDSINFKDIDFSYARFDDSKFYNVNFSNCRLEYTSFNGSKLHQCNFNDLCIIENIDISNAYVDVDIKCKIGEIELSRINCSHISYLLSKKEYKWLPFTLFENINFIENCKENKTLIYINNQYTIINYIKKYNSIKLLHRIMITPIIRCYIIFKNICIKFV